MVLTFVLIIISTVKSTHAVPMLIGGLRTKIRTRILELATVNVSV